MARAEPPPTLPGMLRVPRTPAVWLVGVALVLGCTPAGPANPAAPPTGVSGASAPAASVSPSRAPAANPSASPAASPSASPAANPSASPATSPSAPPTTSLSPAPPPAPAVSPSAAPLASPGVSASLPPAAQPSTLVGSWQWQATQPASGSPLVATDPTRYTITFQADGSLQVRADCNQVLGTYTVSGNSLMVHLGPSTLAACPPDSQADVFTAGLNQVASYALGGATLSLSLADGSQMLFSPLPTPELAGPTWRLTAYNNGRGGVQSILADTQPTALFGADGQLSGSGGCNTFSGPYQSTASSLSIGPLASTFKACEQPIMEQEAAYLQALQQTSTYRFDNGRLVLVDTRGATQAIFER